MPAPIRHLVLDSEAVSALLSPRRNDPKRREVIRALMAANGRRAVPTAVRVEARWDRRDERAADANRLFPRGTDIGLDGTLADRAAELRAAVPKASPVDASVAAVAEHVGASGGVVEILTSDVPLTALAAQLSATTDVTKL